MELDALPVDVLRGWIVDEVGRRMDLDALAHTRTFERTDRPRLDDLLVQARYYP